MRLRSLSYAINKALPSRQRYDMVIWRKEKVHILSATRMTRKSPHVGLRLVEIKMPHENMHWFKQSFGIVTPAFILLSASHATRIGVNHHIKLLLINIE